MATAATHAYRIVNELSMQTHDLIRVQRQLLRLRLAEASRQQAGHEGRLAAYIGGVGAIFLNILGTAPAEHWGYYTSLVLVLVIGVVLVVVEQHRWRSVRESDASLSKDALQLSSEELHVEGEIEFVDNYRECVMLKASVDVRAEDPSRGGPLVDHWRERVQRRVEHVQRCLEGASPERRIDLDLQLAHLRAALAAAGNESTQGA